MAIIFKYPGATACQIAGINKQRFNEAVAAGRYPCAPKVLKGGTRAFREEDIIALFIYARLIEQNMPPRVAGEIACTLRAKLEEYPDADEVSVPRHSETGTVTSERDTYSAHMHMVFDVAGIRSAIRPGLEAHRNGETSPPKED